MAKYTVVIKNRFLDEKTVARIRTFDENNHKNIIFTAKENADLVKDVIQDLIDNDIYYSEVEDEDTDEEN